MFIPPPANIPPPPTQRQLDENHARYRRSNLGGDDLFTKVVFFALVIGIVAYVAFVWINRSTTATPHPPAVSSQR